MLGHRDRLASRLRAARRVLVIRRKALGDALVTLPAVLRLVAAMPRAEIDLVVDRPFAPLLAELARGLRVLVWPPVQGRGWLRRLRSERYDVVIDYLGSPRTALWTGLSGAPLRVGYDLPRRRWAYNVRVPRMRDRDTVLASFAGEAFLDPLRALGLPTPPWRAPAAADEVAATGSAALGGSYRDWIAGWSRSAKPRAVLIMSATWAAKAWPAHRAGQLAELLDTGGVVPLFVPGPGDEALMEELRRVAPRAEIAPPTNLLELADLLRHCQVYVGTDNGARHLAALLGVPTVTLFGPTDPRGWNPADPRHLAVHRDVPCAPCDLVECPVAGHPCLDDLSAETVRDATLALLARTGAAPTGRDEGK